MRDEKVVKIARGGLLAALVLLATYVIKLPVPITNGYVHLGDGVIFLAAMLMGNFAALIAGLGSALADLIGGYFHYIAPTFIIKAAMALLVALLYRTGKHGRNFLVFCGAEVLMVAGYFVFEGFFYNWAAAAGAILPNLVQGIAGIALGMVFSIYLPHLKKRL